MNKSNRIKPDFPGPNRVLDREAWERNDKVEREYLGGLFEPIYDAEQDYEERWLVRNLIPEANLVILAGEPKSGKTCLATALALAVATGTPFAGNPTTQTSVLWLSCEESRLERRIIYKESPLVDSTTPLYTTYDFIPIDTDEGLYYLSHWMDLTKAKLIVVDSLYAAITGRSMGDAWNARKSLMPLKKFCTESGVTALVLHHSKRPAMGSYDRRVGEHDQLAATAGVEMVLTSRQVLAKPGEDRSRVVTLVCKGRSTKLNRYVHFLSKGPLDFTEIGEVDQAPLPERPAFCEDIVLEALKKQAMTADELFEHLNIHGGTIRNALTRLRRKGLIEVKSMIFKERCWGAVVPQDTA